LFDVGADLPQTQVADGESDDGRLVQLSSDGRRQRQQLRQLVELGVLLAASASRRVARPLLAHLYQSTSRVSNVFTDLTPPPHRNIFLSPIARLAIEELLAVTYTGWTNFDSGYAGATYFSTVCGLLPAVRPHLAAARAAVP